MPRKFVKIGETNGKIYVSGLAGRPYRAYQCVCTVCGHGFVGTGQDVFKYSGTGCALCRKRQRDQERSTDARKYIGQQFGGLEIIGITGYREIYGHSQLMVSCRCQKCGNTADYVLSKLKTGQVKQCRQCSLVNLESGHEVLQSTRINGTSVTAIDGRRKVNKNSSTGFTGISYNAKSGKYRAYITFQRKQYYLGIFSDINDAVAARKAAEGKIYGDFLRWYMEAYPEQYKRITVTFHGVGNLNK